MKKSIISVILTFAFMACVTACSDDSPTIGPDYPEEPVTPPVESVLKGSFESKFTRYAKGQKFSGQSDDDKIVTVWKDTLWQNDRAHKQLVLWSEHKRYDAISYEVSDLLNGENRISASQIRLRFPSYVMGDATAKTCGEYTTRSTALIADALSDTPVTTVGTSEPVKVWVTADVPSNTPPGVYTGSIVVKSAGELQQTFTLQFQVTGHQLPSPKEWEFHLDLWQFPFQLTGLCTNNGKKIVPFSDEYFSLVKPFYQLLADAGQKTITTYIKDGAFNPDQTMVKWNRGSDGEWNFDYMDFDKYVAAMMSWGVNAQINCFSLVGWDSSIGYTDSSGATQRLELTIGSDEYNAVWTTFLDSFRAHLKEKGWFDKAILYMDEVKEDDMRKVVSLLRKHDPAWKIGLSGGFIPADVEPLLYDYSTILGYDRNSTNTVATFYTSCSQGYPNNFVTTENNPAEMPWMAWYARAKGFNGYLRWAFDYWTKSDPMNVQDGSNAAGDFCMIYRDGNTQSAKPVSSIRLELLREGIQDYEKVRILSTNEMNMYIQKFTTNSGRNAEKLVTEAQKMLKELSVKY